MSHVAGYCGNTKGDIQSPPSPTCRSFFGSPASPEMPSSLRECALRCKECDACTIVSYSKQTGDCTLYSRCNMSSVSKGYGYTTHAIRQAAGDEAVVPAETDDPPSCSFSCNAQRPCPLHERRCGSLSMLSAMLHEHLSSWMRGKHIVFVGSSVTRYQYLNLAYHLLHGRPPPFDLTDYSYELRRATGVSAPTKTGDYEGYWSGYYNATVRALNMPAEHGRHDPANKERCDCYRGRPESSHIGDDKWRGLGFRESEMHNIDMRYTRTGARHGHAALTYAQWFMDTVPFRGHWFREFYTSGVEHAHGSSPRTSTEDCKPGTCGPPYDFEFGGVSGPELEYRLKAAAKTKAKLAKRGGASVERGAHGSGAAAEGAKGGAHGTGAAESAAEVLGYSEPLLELVHNVLFKLRPRPTHFVLGAPWPGGVNGATWMGSARAENLLAAGDAITCAACRAGGVVPRFVWKSDTQTAPCNPRGSMFDRANVGKGQYLPRLARAHSKWLVFDLWGATEAFGNECYNDGFHFNELARTHFNELLLTQLMDEDARTGGNNASWCAEACSASGERPEYGQR